MAKEHNFRNDRFGCRPLEDGPVSAGRSKTCVDEGTLGQAKGGVQLARASQRTSLGRQVAAGLVGVLLISFAMLAVPSRSSARVSIGVFVNFGPPALPYYAQPPCPAPGYIWTPGYWAWDPAYGYYWVPGTWVPAPFVGAMWTPGYWGFFNNGYRWHPGYWGYAVGYYGGINYGFGYTGYGYHGGYWNRGHFFYNRSVNRIAGRNFRHLYSRRVDDHFRGGRVSYNGGPGGINVRPTRQQLAAARRRRFGAVSQQIRHEQFARRDPAQRARVNHGRPGIAATGRPGAFRGRDIVHASRAGAPYREPARRTGGRETSRPAQGRSSHERGFRSFDAPRNAGANARRETRAPVQRRPEQQVYRNNSPRNYQRAEHQARPQEMRRVESRPVQRGNERPTYQQSRQHQARPQQTRRAQARPAQEQRGSSPRQEARGSGNDHGGGNGHGGGNSHGRGGRH